MVPGRHLVFGGEKNASEAALSTRRVPSIAAPKPTIQVRESRCSVGGSAISVGRSTPSIAALPPRTAAAILIASQVSSASGWPLVGPTGNLRQCRTSTVAK
jgi:hypothetical protein